MNILHEQTVEKAGFTIVVKLEGLDFLSEFHNKYTPCQDGLLKGSEGNWVNNYLKVGKLKDGNDITGQAAQKEFERDCEAFDVLLSFTVLKNNIELLNEYGYGSDFNYNDKITPEELTNYLLSDNEYTIDEYIEQAQEVLKDLLK